jgi:hypothetical protein
VYLSFIICFVKKKIPFTLWLIFFAAAIFLIAFVPTMINFIFEMKEAGAKKEL